MDPKISKEERYLRARKRVDELKSFYIHFGVYISINLFISGRQVYRDLEDGFTLTESLTEINTYWIWIFWGIGVCFHALKVFGSQFFLGRNWEDKKIKEFMEKNKK